MLLEHFWMLLGLARLDNFANIGSVLYYSRDIIFCFEFLKTQLVSWHIVIKIAFAMRFFSNFM